MSLITRPFGPHDPESWDTYVRSHPFGTPFHLLAWRDSISTTFGYTPTYLVAEENGRLCGILPLFLVENFVIGKVMISSPFAVYGGILADTPQVLLSLAEYAKRVAVEHGVEYLELRNARPEQCAGFAPVTRYVTFTQPLEPGMDEEAILQSVSKKTRNLIRKALKSPFQTRPAADLRAFERLMARNYRRLGTPCFPHAHFAALLRNFGPLADVREVVLDGKVVAASMNFLFRGEMHTYYAASDADYLSLSPNNYLYFAHLLWASNNGYHTFDFGRSKRDTGTFEFKRHWGTSMRELPYEVLLVKRKEMPNYNPTNPRFSAAIKAWQNIPLPLTKILGPRLVRLFP
jgi:FemAB-related protein (PEP-CTERM system-associated)